MINKTRHDMRRNDILRQQSATSGKYRGAPRMTEDNLTTSQKNLLDHSKRLQKFVNRVAHSKLKMYPGHVSHEWCEMLMMVTKKRRISEADQELIAEDIYSDVLNVPELIGSISAKLDWFKRRIEKHHDLILEQRKQCDSFHSILEDL